MTIHAASALMKSGLSKFFTVAGLVALFAVHGFAAETNSLVSITNADVVANGILQLQAQLHEAQLQIAQSRQEAAAEAQRNAEAMDLRIQALEQTIAAQRASDAEAGRRFQQFTLFLAGGVGLAGLGIMLLMAYLQWRAFSQLAEFSSQRHSLITAGEGVHQLAAPGRATVEASNARLLDIVGRLEKRIHELESGGRLLAEPPVKSADPLDEGQGLLDANEPQQALASFEKFLSAHPQHAEALIKKAAALEKLNRLDEALACCDRAIAANGAPVMAYLHKGGLLNRLQRYEEALKCYEQAMLAQEKNAAAKVN